SFGHDLINHRFHVVGAPKRGELSIRAGAFAHDALDMRHLALTAKLANLGRNKLEQFIEQTARFDFRFAAKVDQFAIDSVTRRSPAIFIEQTPPINTKGRVVAKQLEELGNDCLDQGGDREGVVHARLGIADADFERIENRMESNVPPNFLWIIDAAG